MLYNTGLEWKKSSNKRISLFGMSGVGKTFIANILRESKEWFHYSVDYRIGTRYLGEEIVDNFKKEAMKIPFFKRTLIK
jgi:dephospho-CoA kinase